MKQLPIEILELIATYEKSQAKLIQIIATAETRGNVTAYRKRILKGVNEELNELNKYAAKWVAGEIPKSYALGFDKSYKMFKNAGNIGVNTKVVKNLVDNTIGQLVDASYLVGRRIDDEIRKAGVEAVKQKVSTGSTVKETKAILLNNLASKGVTIRDSAGRQIKLDVYASLVARTTTREATNTGSMQAVTDLGGDLVQMSQHFSSCPICSVYEGRVFSISGNSKDYPPLDEAFSGYNTIHVNCSHSITPFFEEFSNKVDQLKEESYRPFELEPKDKKSIDAYNKDQKVKSDRRTDRNAWEKSKLDNPNTATKTFSGYRAQQRAKK